MCRRSPEAAINLHHHPEDVTSALGDRAEGVDLHYFHEPALLGTAGGIKNAEAFLRKDGEPFFVLNADAPCGADLASALAHHQKNGFLATLILRRSPDARRFGTLSLDEAGRLRGFLEAKAPGPAEGAESEAMFTGLSVLSPDLLDQIPSGRPCGISEEIYPRLVREGAPLGAVLTDAYWADAGTPERFLEANFDLLAGRFTPGFPWPADDDIMLEGGELSWDDGRIVPPVLIGPDVRIGQGAVAGPFTVLMRGATLASGASVSESVLFPGASVSDEATCRHCILGPGAEGPAAGGSSTQTMFLAGDGDFAFFSNDA